MSIFRSEFVNRIPKSDTTAHDIISRSPKRQILLPNMPRPPSALSNIQPISISQKPQTAYSIQPHNVLERHVPESAGSFSPSRVSRLNTQQLSMGEKPGQISYVKPPQTSAFQRACSPTPVYRPLPPNQQQQLESPKKQTVDFSSRFTQLISAPDRSQDRFVKHRFNLTFREEMQQQEREEQQRTAALQKSIISHQAVEMTQCNDFEENLSLIQQKAPKQEELLFPYDALTDRQLVVAEPCDFELETEAGIPYSGNIREQRHREQREKDLQQRLTTGNELQKRSQISGQSDNIESKWDFSSVSKHV